MSSRQTRHIRASHLLQGLQGLEGLTLLQRLTPAAVVPYLLPAAIRFVLNDVSNMRGEERQQLLHVSTCLAQGNAVGEGCEVSRLVGLVAGKH